MPNGLTGVTVVPQEGNSGRASRVYLISKEQITEDNTSSILTNLFNFTYRIHTFRDAANPSGNIECEIEMIDGAKYSVFNLISLEVPGISGTDYSIIARIINTRGELKRAITESSNAYQLSVSVYNSKGEKI
jgi:outer membrane receptor for monomeric catechols